MKCCHLFKAWKQQLITKIHVAKLLLDFWTKEEKRRSQLIFISDIPIVIISLHLALITLLHLIMSQQTFEQFLENRLNTLGLTLAELDKNDKMDLSREYASRQGKYTHVPVYHPYHVSITHASHISIALSALKSCYNFHLICPTQIISQIISKHRTFTMEL